MDILISLGSSAADALPIRTASTWPQFVQWLYQLPRKAAGLTPAEHAYLKQFPSKSPEGERIHADKSGPYVVLADFGGGRRALDSLLGSYGVPLDFDSGQVTAEVIAQVLTGYSYVAYTTYAHGPDAERWRVFVPVARPMTHTEHYATWQMLSHAFPGGADPAAKDPSRLSYLPGTCLNPDAARMFHADGAFLQPAPAIEPPTTALQVPSAGPVPGWAGPSDDETLIAVACSLRLRPDEKFGHPIHFAMLWAGDEAWLGEKFPPSASEQGQTYSRTQADMALAGELAFFTGSDLERMHRLMLASGLARDDEDWQTRKALRACERACENAKQWYFMSRDTTGIEQAVDSKGPAAAPAPPTDMSAMEALQINVGAMPGLNDYWSDHETGEFIHRPTGKHHPATVVDNIIGKDARIALYSSRPVHGMTWAPGYPERFQIKDIDPTDEKGAACWLYNRYQAPRTPTRAGDVTLWLSLVQRLYPDDWQHIVHYFADAVQHPARKCNHALVLGSGVHGIGKDTLLLPLRHAVGPKNYSTIRPGALTDNTNPWVASRVVHISESRDGGEGFHSVSRYEFYERCKDLAAAPPVTIEVNDKYIRKHQVLNVLRLVITTNHAVDGLYLDPEDRRHYCAWSDAEKMSEAEGAAIHAWYDAGGLDYVANFLATYDLGATAWNHAARPLQTAWWQLLVAGGRSAEDERFTDAVEKLGRPEWLTTAQIAAAGGTELAGWMGNPANRRKVEREMDRAGYRRLPNPQEPKRGRWFVEGRQVPIYRRSDLPERVLLERFKLTAAG